MLDYDAGGRKITPQERQAEERRRREASGPRRVYLLDVICAAAKLSGHTITHVIYRMPYRQMWALYRAYERSRDEDQAIAMSLSGMQASAYPAPSQQLTAPQMPFYQPTTHIQPGRA